MTSIAHASKQKWIIAITAIVLLVAIAFPVYLDHERGIRDNKNLRCISTWANATAQRADRVLALSNAKNKATDDLFRAVAAKNVNGFNAALKEYLAASNSYNNALKLNPLPGSPQFNCLSGTPLAGPSAIVVTETTPNGTVVITATPGVSKPTPATVVEPMPTTIVAPEPGRTITVTVTPKPRTVTRTVSPPSCRQHPVPPCLVTFTFPVAGG